jgi:hypothetical protein
MKNRRKGIASSVANIIQNTKKAANAAALIRNYSKLDGASCTIWDAVTITPGAGENVGVDTAYSISTKLLTLDATEDNNNLVVDKATLWIECQSTDTLFTAFPFLVTMENGESISQTSGTDSDPESAIDTAITGQFVVQLGDPVFARIVLANDTYYYTAHTNLDVTQHVRKYMQHVAKARLEERNPLALELGILNICSTDNKGTTFWFAFHCVYHFEQSQILNI